MTCALLATNCFLASFFYECFVDEGSVERRLVGILDPRKLQDLFFFDDILPHLFKEMHRKISK